ncbi:MAG: hypothetical protein IPK16_08320 [Anaerolineales bacterium]|nr:hypothetical protein [Anaerolineales bacterium]
MSNTYDSWNFYVMPFPAGARQLLATVGTGNWYTGTGSQLAPDSKTLLVYTDLDSDRDYELWTIRLQAARSAKSLTT